MEPSPTPSTQSADCSAQMSLDMSTIEYVRIHWVDYSGVLRTRFLPKASFLRVATGEKQYTLSQACMVVPVVATPRCRGVEGWALYPDLGSLRRYGLAEHHADVMCAVAQETVANAKTDDKFAYCPRSLLRRTVESLEQDYAMGMLAGFEIEFVLLDSDSQLHWPESSTR